MSEIKKALKALNLRAKQYGMEVHHILPVAQGGGDEAQNLVSLCRNCHQKRHRNLKGEIET